ncbi:MAG: DUF1311 domain-containing protein [Sphingomonas sp.]|uniref:lysozyme inhibitor LprI family protein n=1 Tax=Sphingomonas sp. TaxID=28214 RepID=UPI0025D4BE7C|nr:lysozyme inhibitor LprI family protein [Sphingomonas sp.]MBX3564420.1 DUF1311 domain-containing protein [Sphingomonas sp.]
MLLAVLAALPPDCRAPTSEAVRIECAQMELTAAEQAMSYALARVLDNARLGDGGPRAVKLSPSREARVKTAQEAWLHYRDTQCAAAWAPAGLEVVNRIWCHTRLTKERTAELNINFIVD